MFVRQICFIYLFLSSKNELIINVYLTIYKYILCNLLSFFKIVLIHLTILTHLIIIIILSFFTIKTLIFDIIQVAINNIVILTSCKNNNIINFKRFLFKNVSKLSIFLRKNEPLMSNGIIINSKKSSLSRQIYRMAASMVIIFNRRNVVNQIMFISNHFFYTHNDCCYYHYNFFNYCYLCCLK